MPKENIMRRQNKLSIVKLEEPSKIKIEISDDEVVNEEKPRYVPENFPSVEHFDIKKGILNIKIVGKKKGKKIRKHTYLSSQQTLDKYVRNQNHSSSKKP